MYVIVTVEGEEDRIIGDAAAVVCGEFPNEVRICRDGREDEVVVIGRTTQTRVTVTS